MKRIVKQNLDTIELGNISDASFIGAEDDGDRMALVATEGGVHFLYLEELMRGGTWIPEEMSKKEAIEANPQYSYFWFSCAVEFVEWMMQKRN